MRASAQWSGAGFRNIRAWMPRPPIDMTPAAGNFTSGQGRRVPQRPLPTFDPRPLWRRCPDTGLRATWLGHSTALLEIDGVRVLTDPVWGPRASPTRWFGPKRFQPVPVALAALPPIDVVLISHDHYDHLDYPTVCALAGTEAVFVVALGVGAHLEAWGVPVARIVELDWWESYTLPAADLTVTAAPAQHFSGRGLKDRNATLWVSFALRSARHAVFFSGDTGLTAEYAAIRERLGPFDLVLLEVGAFHPAWSHIHLGPVNALQALALLGGGTLLPVHWGTFGLAWHAWDEPAETLWSLAPARGASLAMPRLGEPIEPARVRTPIPWWRAANPVAKRAASGPAKLAPQAWPRRAD